MADKIIVQFTPQRRGFNFAVHPTSRRRLDEIGGVAPAASNVFIGRDDDTDPDELEIPAVERQVVELLTGVSAGNLLEVFDAIEFRRMPEGETEHVLRA